MSESDIDLFAGIDESLHEMDTVERPHWMKPDGGPAPDLEVRGVGKGSFSRVTNPEVLRPSRTALHVGSASLVSETLKDEVLDSSKDEETVEESEATKEIVGGVVKRTRGGVLETL